MASDKKKDKKPREVASDTLEHAKLVVESADKTTPKAAARDPMDALNGLVDLYRTKSTIKGLQVMEKAMDRELSDDNDQPGQTPNQKQTAANASQEKNSNPLNQLLASVGEEKRDQLAGKLIESLLESDDKDMVYELLAGQNPGAKRLLGTLKQQQTTKSAQPANDFESMSNSMMNMMKMMGLGSVMKSSEETNSLQNMMAMFTFLQSMSGNNNKNDSNADLMRGLSDLTRTMNESNQNLSRTIIESNTNVLNAIRESLVNRPQGNENSSQLEFLKTIYETNSSHQSELVRQQMENAQNRIAEKETFWEAQFRILAEQNEQFKQMLTNQNNRPSNSTDPRLLNDLVNGIQELKSRGLIQQTEDKEIRLKEIESKTELDKLDKTLTAKTNHQLAQATNLANVVTLVSGFLDRGRQPAPPNQVNPAKPSASASRMAGIPVPMGSVASMKGVN
jgi:hypothetical protein